MGRTVSLSALLALGLAFADSSWADEVFDAWGFVQNRDFFSQLPYEHIDPLSGNLLLTFTDLALPGNAGFDLRIQRTYNSKIYRNFSTLGDLLDEDSWAGVGWTMHLGRVLNPEPLGAAPVIEMPDGRRQRAYAHVDGSGRFITKEYWVYDANSVPPVLSLPNGVTYSLGLVAALPGIGNVRYVTQITDPFGNRIDVQYGTTSNAPPEGISRVTQWLSGSVRRVVTFTYDNATRRSLRTIQFSSGGKTHTWTYSHSTATFAGVQHSLLTDVKPPVGPSWKYRYNTTNAPRYELTRLTTPNGGQVDYSYDTIEFFRPGTSTVVRSRAMVRRVTGGRDLPSGTWDFDYAQGSSRNKTVSTSPCGRTTYTFLGIGSGSSQLSAWQVGLLGSKVLSEGPVLEEEELEWLRSVAISNEDESVGFYRDSEIYIPLMEKRTVRRGAKNYVTTNSYRTTNFNDFGRPWKIVESGDLTRTTTRVFRYGFGPYIVDRVASETVQVTGDQAFTTSRTFDLSDGFVKSETVYGIRTTFTPDGFGNVARLTNANNNTTQFTYSNGVLRNTTTPEYTITRIINADGTIASETQRGLTTRFEYDRLFRTTVVDPAVGNNIVTEYDNQNGSFRRVKRGSSVVTTDLDGFGRVSGTSNSIQVKTDAVWDACGRRVYQSYPFTGQNIGTAFEYDALGRLKKKTNTGPNTRMTYSYLSSNGIDVTIEDERGRTTFQDWSAFGDPRDARLARLTDARGALWQYGYNTLGGQTFSDPPGGAPNRRWTFNSRNQLERETHPESGTLTYSYDAAGNLKTRTDAAFGRTTYHYDRNERLIRIERPGGYNRIEMAYDHSDNRILLNNGDVRSTFTYDGANRLARREDVIDGVTFVTRYAYDGNDNLVRIDYPSGQVVQYSYDSGNRITLVHGGSTTFASNFGYHPSGGVASYRAGNNLTHSFTYDDRYRVKEVFDNGRVLDLRYTYDDVGNVTDIVDGRPGMNQTYRYDQLDRLTTANGFWGNGSFTYDQLGNMTRRTIDGVQSVHSYNVSKQRLTSSTNPVDSFSYDANGNLIRDDAGVYTYTPENMLESATLEGSVTEYRYDGDNLRKLKSSEGKAQFYVHGPGNQLLSEFEERCAGEVFPVRDYVNAGSRLIAAVRPDSAPTEVAFEVASSAAEEGVGSVAIAVKLSTAEPGSTPCSVTVRYATEPGTGAAGTDYVHTEGTLTFPAGSNDGDVQNITVPVLDDLLDEPDVTFTVSLSDVVGAAPGSTIVHTVSILDDNGPPAISVGDCAVTEGNTGTASCVMDVSLSAASAFTVESDFATADGSAQVGADYVAVSGTINFEPGATSQQISVQVTGDVLDEPNETLLLNLSGVTNASVADGQAVGTILDDDAAPSLSIADASVTDGNSGTVFARFGVSLSAASGQNVTVDYTTEDVLGEATAGVDYVPQSGTLTFSPESTSQTISVAVTSDGVDEDGETFLVKLSNPDKATMTDAEAVGTIYDERSPRGDFNSDLNVDVIWYNHMTGNSIVAYMEDAMMLDFEFMSPSKGNDLNWKIVGSADFNDDGKTDLVLQHQSSGDVNFEYMDGATGTSDEPMDPPNVGSPNWKVAGTGEFNGDGMDLVWQNEVTRNVGVSYLNGATMTGGVLTEPANLGGVSWSVVGTGDFNGDGHTDIVTQEDVSGDVGVAYMEGIKMIGWEVLTNAGDPAWKVVGVEDFNRDGNVDLLAQHETSGDVGIAHLNGLIMMDWVPTTPNNAGSPNWKIVGPR